MSRDQELKALYEQLAESGPTIAGGGLDVSKEKVGIARFQMVSSILQKQVCTPGSKLQNAAAAGGLTAEKAKQEIENVAKGVLIAAGLAAGWAGAIAGIAVYLFFDTAVPHICRKWKEWNESPHANPYQPNLEHPDPFTQGG